MEREELFEEVKKRVKEENISKHLLATEALMRALANKFREDLDK
jgi:predicted hydrolase (HD superfamily)